MFRNVNVLSKRGTSIFSVSNVLVTVWTDRYIYVSLEKSDNKLIDIRCTSLSMKIEVKHVRLFRRFGTYTNISQ